MALKDWLQGKSAFYLFVAKNKKLNQSIYVEKKYGYCDVYIEDGSKWGGKQIDYKQFKILSPVLKFAKDYMGEH